MIIQAGQAAGAGPRPRQYIEMHGATIMGSWARPLLAATDIGQHVTR